MGWTLLLWLAPLTAQAQLPIPELDTGNAPQVRMASTDAFIDRVRAFKTRIEKESVARKEANQREREALEQQLEEIQQYEESLGAQTRFDPEVAKKILEILDREDELLGDAIDLASRALSVSDRRGEEPEKQRGFERLVELMLQAERLEEEAHAAEAVAERLRSLADLGNSSRPGDSLPDRLVRHEWRLQAVQVDHALAVSMETRARARVARARVDEARARLAVTLQDALRAEEDLSRTEAEIEEAKSVLLDERRHQKQPAVSTEGLDATTAGEVREAERAAMLAQFDLIDRRRDAEESRYLQALARAVAIRALATHRTPDWPAKIAPVRVSAELATISQQQTTIEAQLDRLREGEEKLGAMSVLRRMYRARRGVLEEILGVLRENKQHVEAIAVIERAAVARSDGQTRRRTPFQLALMTIGAVLLGLLALTFGLRTIYRLTDPETGVLKLPQKYAGRGRTLIALCWPLLVLGATSSILIWPIWRIDLSPAEVLRTVDHPLFYVDEKPVSALSVLLLCFAVWASFVMSRVLRDFLSTRVYKHLGWDIGLTNALNTLVHYVMMLLGIIIGARFVGIGASSLAVLFGILGIGIGFGLRNIAENFISGLIILAERPIKIGDFVEIDGRVEGQIQTISARSTTVVTRDNISIIIPNSEFVGQRVTNWSHGDPKVRIHIQVGVAYGTDTDLVRKTLLEVARKHGQVLKKPGPEVWFKEFASSSLNFVLLVWIDEQYHRFRIASDLHFAIDAAFRKLHIEIAFPQLDLHIKTVSTKFAQALHPEPLMDGEEAAPHPMNLPEGRPRGSVPHKPA
jgi:small-conductance mechanosensitive channel